MVLGLPSQGTAWLGNLCTGAIADGSAGEVTPMQDGCDVHTCSAAATATVSGLASSCLALPCSAMRIISLLPFCAALWRSNQGMLLLLGALTSLLCCCQH